MANFKDITGQKFGRLTAIRVVGKTKNGITIWLCKCDCGNTTEVRSTCLRSGESQSCGCITKERVSARNYRHGMFGTRIYEIWRKMRRRCRCKSEKSYRDYGGRGIRVCDEWNNSKTGFDNFYRWSMSNGYAENLSIDRIDNNGNYEPSNCRWATMKEQSNNRRSNHNVSYRGKEQTISEWADELHIDQRLLRQTLSRHNWDLEQALKNIEKN